MKNETEEKPVTFSQMKDYLIEFYQQIVEPGMERMFDRKFDEKIQPIKEDMRQGFDDLYKKYETLTQEMTVMSCHLGRVEEGLGRVEERLTGVEGRLFCVERKLLVPLN